MQLDIFDQPKGPARIYRFPLIAKASLVESSALALATRSVDEGRKWWRQHSKELRKEMRSAGLPPHLIEEQIGEYGQLIGDKAEILHEYLSARVD